MVAGIHSRESAGRLSKTARPTHHWIGLAGTPSWHIGKSRTQPDGGGTYGTRDRRSSIAATAATAAPGLVRPRTAGSSSKPASQSVRSIGKGGLHFKAARTGAGSPPFHRSGSSAPTLSLRSTSRARHNIRAPRARAIRDRASDQAKRSRRSAESASLRTRTEKGRPFLGGPSHS